MDDIKKELKILTNKVESLIKITEACCEYLKVQDTEFEQFLESKLLSQLNSMK